MNATDMQQISAWLIQSGLRGASETTLLKGFCERCHGAGLNLSRGMAIIDTLHPTYEGRAFRWRNDGIDEEAMVEYGRTLPETWQRSVFYHLLTTGGDEYRCRLDEGDRAEYHNHERSARSGAYRLSRVDSSLRQRRRDRRNGLLLLALDHRAAPKASALPGLNRSRLLVPQLALAIKCASLTRIAGTLVEAYLGHDAGRRVLSGRIARGVADTHQTRCCGSPICAASPASPTRPRPTEIIPLLNDYAEAVISVDPRGGRRRAETHRRRHLASSRRTTADACRCALTRQARSAAAVQTLNARRGRGGAAGDQSISALHIGDVFYGNIGSENRLDFTVVGPAVNEVSRIAAMCRSVDRNVLPCRPISSRRRPRRSGRISSRSAASR